MTAKTGPAAAFDTVIFLHIPKTAGRTLEAILEREHVADEIYNIYGDIPQAVAGLRALPDAEKRRYRLVKGHYQFGLHADLPQRTTYITFLRDPVDRVISHYYYIKRDRDHKLHEAVEAGRISLQDYVAGGMSIELDNGQTRLLAGEEHDHAFGQCPPELLDKAKRHMEEHCAVVGLVDRFDESLLLMKQALGWDCIFYVKRNVSRTRPPKRAIPEDTLALIRRYNELDLELYACAQRRLQEMIAAGGAAFQRDLNWFRRRNGLYESYLEMRTLPKRFVRKIKHLVRG